MIDNEWQRVVTMDVLRKLAKAHVVGECMNKHCTEPPLWMIVSHGHNCGEADCQGDVAVLTCTVHKNEIIESAAANESFEVERIDPLN